MRTQSNCPNYLSDSLFGAEIELLKYRFGFKSTERNVDFSGCTQVNYMNYMVVIRKYTMITFILSEHPVPRASMSILFHTFAFSFIICSWYLPSNYLFASL